MRFEESLPRETKMNVVLCDFDGTIVNIDTGVFALEKFASGDWKALDLQLENGEITFEECLRRQFRMITAPTEVIVKAVDEVAILRPYFVHLVNYCNEKGIKVIIVSGGLDFYIKHFLSKFNLEIDVRAPECTYTADGLTLKFPALLDSSSFSLKDDLVRQYRRQGVRVLYVGDGYADYYALKEANVPFAIAGSTSARLCSKDSVCFQTISDFSPVLNELRRREEENWEL